MAVKKGATKLYIENSIALQKILADLAEKVDSLTKQISTLVEIFDDAAKSFSPSAGREKRTEDSEEKNLINKLDNLIDQNKDIARGLMLLEEQSGEEKEKLKSFPDLKL